MKKGLLFVFDIFPSIGGVESVSNNIIDYLSEYFSIYTLSACSLPGVPTSSYISEMFKFNSILDIEGSVTQLDNIIKEKKIEFIINQGIYPEITNIILHANRTNGAKVYSFLHGMPKYEEKQYWQIPQIANTSRLKLLKRKFLSKLNLYSNYKLYTKKYTDTYRKACQEGSKVILLCNEYIPIFIRKYQLQKYQEKITSIENPLSASFSIEKDIKWSDKKNKILFVGRLSKEKRVDIILDIWKCIETITDWELTIVGNGETYSDLKNMVQKLQLSRVSFTGQVNHMEDYYKEAKMILLTSNFEGFPMCLIEAQRFGVVPIVFNISKGVSSIIKHGGGIIINNHNKKVMSKKILELIHDKNTLQHLSKEATIKSNRYTLNIIGAQWLQLLSQ